MAKKRITAAEYAEAHKQFTQFVSSKLASMGASETAKRFKGNGPIAKLISRRQYDKYLESGGKAGDWESFFKFLMENLPAIIAAIMALFG